MIQLGEHFASEDRGRHSEWLRGQQWFIKARQDNERRDAVEDKAEQNASAFASAVVMATEAQIAEFEVRLDSYDEATVIALMENRDLLDAANARIDALRAQAYVMQDGRRVFRTEDGAQVFDEFGGEITAEELNPDLIDPSYPTWEAFSAEVDQRQELTQQRTEILEFQERVDAAHEQIADGEISETDLEALDAELLDVMPPAVRDHVAGLVASAPQLDGTVEFNDQSATPTRHAETASPAPVPFQ